MSQVNTSILANMQNSFMNDSSNETLPSTQNLQLDQLNADNQEYGAFESKIADFINGTTNYKKDILTTIQNNQGTSLSTTNMLNIQKNITNYTVSMDVTSKVAGAISKGINQLTSIQ